MITSLLPARNLRAFGAVSKETRALSRSAAVILRQAPHMGTDSLWQLARAGDTQAVTDIVQHRQHPKLDWARTNQKGETLLMEALRRGHTGMVEALIGAPAAASTGISTHRDNVLHYLVEHGDCELIQRLLDRHPMLYPYADCENHQDTSPLGKAFEQRHESIAAALSKRPLEQIDTMAAPPSPYETRVASRLKIINDVLAKHETPFLVPLLDSLPPATLRENALALLQRAAACKDFPSFRLLFGHANIGPISHNAKGELLRAVCDHGDAAQLQWLLRQPGIQQVVHTRNDKGQTALLVAAHHGKLDCVNLLARHYADALLADVDSDGAGVLQTALESGINNARDLLAFNYSSPPLIDRLTSDDLMRTLKMALGNLCINTSDNDLPYEHMDVSSYSNLIKHLLSQPQGRIDIYAPFNEDHTILTLLESNDVEDALKVACQDVSETQTYTIESHFAEYEGATLYHLAKQHNQSGHAE